MTLIYLISRGWKKWIYYISHCSWVCLRYSIYLSSYVVLHTWVSLGQLSSHNEASYLIMKLELFTNSHVFWFFVKTIWLEKKSGKIRKNEIQNTLSDPWIALFISILDGITEVFKFCIWLPYARHHNQFLNTNHT